MLLCHILICIHMPSIALTNRVAAVMMLVLDCHCEGTASVLVDYVLVEQALCC